MMNSQDKAQPKRPGPVQVTVCLSTEAHHCAKIAATQLHETVPAWIADLVTDACVSPAQRNDPALKLLEVTREKAETRT
jgi:hypothetical protein